MYPVYSQGFQLCIRGLELTQVDAALFLMQELFPDSWGESTTVQKFLHRRPKQFAARNFQFSQFTTVQYVHAHTHTHTHTHTQQQCSCVRLTHAILQVQTNSQRSWKFILRENVNVYTAKGLNERLPNLLTHRRYSHSRLLWLNYTHGLSCTLKP